MRKALIAPKSDLALSVVAFLAVLGAIAVPAPAAEPASAAGVAIDWQALDALPPATSSPGTITLQAPPKPKLAAAPAAAPPPPKPRAPAAAAPAPPAQIEPAAVAATLAPGRIGVVPYPKDQVDLPPAEAGVVDSVAQKLAGDPRARLQLVAYASGHADDALAARRISLARAVQMRSYLIEKGVPSVRVDVRALGDKDAGDGPADRVDLMIIER
jgi:outer membrane protein OmpA-like peptidoglycan-associated protein